MFDDLFTTTSLPATPKAPPATVHLGRDLDGWLEAAAALAGDLPISGVPAELEELKNRRRLPGFRLAFVGEFSRGKSTLINRLLERELLPIGALPTTATLTSIVPGFEDQLEVRLPGGARTVRPLDESAWQDLIASGGNEPELLAQVRLSVDSAWLRRLDLEVVDTPGAGDLSSQRAALVAEALGQCDAAVLVVSATLPFSLTEAAFLEQEVIGRRIPRILVAVSKLDLVPPGERVAAFTTLQARVAQVSPLIPVLPLHGLDPAQDDSTVFEAVRTQIEVLVAAGERRVWRNRQVTALLADALARWTEAGQTALNASGADDREAAAEKLRTEIAGAELRWEQVRLGLEQRSQKCLARLNREVAAASSELPGVLALGLLRTTDPKLWWETELPLQLRRELIALSRRLEELSLRALAEDFAWLEKEMQNGFAASLERPETGELASVDLRQPLLNIPLEDLRQYRLFTRLGSTAAVVGSFLFGGPLFGLLASAGIAVLSEDVANRKAEEVRARAQQQLNGAIERTLDEYSRTFAERVRKLYSQLIEQIRQEQQSWLSARHSALVAAEQAQAGEREVWQRGVEAAESLRCKLLSGLQG